jgi:4-diphosphocytidyl-2-C-methyl-D-erythritol kinase
MITFPNAKINIGLHIIRKRPDGFHDIESILYPIKRFDALEVLKSARMEFIQSGIEIPGNISDNLCLKAYTLIKRDFDIPPVKVHLLKKIPIGAGLGGGSADAAFFIRLLNNLFDLELSIERMEDYCRRLGSDCAFFIENKPVYAYGKGDEFEPLELNLESYRIEVIKPNIHISTAEAYANVKPAASESNLRELIKLPVNEWRSIIKNDFESSVFSKYPEIEKLKNEFYKRGALYASMSGSGSAVYGIFELKPEVGSLMFDL